MRGIQTDARLRRPDQGVWHATRSRYREWCARRYRKIDGSLKDVPPMELAALVVREVLMGDANVATGGGAENMSRAPYITPDTRFGARMGNARLADSSMTDA